MSALLVGIGSLFIAPSELTLRTMSILSSRDALLAMMRVYLILTYSNGNFDAATLWCTVDTIISLFRLIRNPLQLHVNQLHNRPEVTLSSTQEFLVGMFSLDLQIHHCFNQSLFVSFDWLTYFIYLFGVWLLGMQVPKPSSTDNTSGNKDTPQIVSPPPVPFLLTFCRYDIAITICFFSALFVMYVLIYTSNRCTGGFLFTGAEIDGSHWPQTCPRLYFDRSLWRRRGEPLSEYRLRRRRIMSQYNAMPAMTRATSGRNIAALPRFGAPNPVPRLTETELRQLRTFIYSDEENAQGKDGIPLEDIPSEDKAPVVVMIPPNSSRNSLSPDASVEFVAEESAAEEIQQASGAVEDHDGPKSTDTMCALCLCDYEEGDRLRELKCQHRFHAECIDEWLLRSKRNCPVCTRDALNPDEPPQRTRTASITSASTGGTYAPLE